MPITKSAKKAARQAKVRTERNLVYKNRIKNLAKQIKRQAEAKNDTQLGAMLSDFYKAVDKAAKRRVLDKNKAARLKSSLLRAVESLTGSDITLSKKSSKAPSSK